MDGRGDHVVARHEVGADDGEGINRVLDGTGCRETGVLDKSRPDADTLRLDAIQVEDCAVIDAIAEREKRPVRRG